MPGNDTQFFSNLMTLIASNVHVLQMCRVVDYCDRTKTAAVQPLSLKIDGTKRGLIQGALVLKHVEGDIIGKVVAVIFADGDLDELAGSDDYLPSSTRQHNVNDAVVIGVWDR